jgi:hypothetical protein
VARTTVALLPTWTGQGRGEAEDAVSLEPPGARFTNALEAFQPPGLFDWKRDHSFAVRNQSAPARMVRV